MHTCLLKARYSLQHIAINLLSSYHTRKSSPSSLKKKLEHIIFHSCVEKMPCTSPMRSHASSSRVPERSKILFSPIYLGSCALPSEYSSSIPTLMKEMATPLAFSARLRKQNNGNTQSQHVTTRDVRCVITHQMSRDSISPGFQTGGN